MTFAAPTLAGYKNIAAVDLPPVKRCRILERESLGGATQERALEATREEVLGGADH